MSRLDSHFRRAQQNIYGNAGEMAVFRSIPITIHFGNITEADLTKYSEDPFPTGSTKIHIPESVFSAGDPPQTDETLRVGQRIYRIHSVEYDPLLKEYALFCSDDYQGS